MTDECVSFLTGGENYILLTEDSFHASLFKQRHGFENKTNKLMQYF